MLLDERALKIEQRKFEADVSSALLTFERAREWADLTSCLNRLHKSLGRAPPQLTDVPYSDVVVKRLGQCLNPTLPAGVHSKCLDVYRAIFLRIQTDGLAQELGLWTPGLFPLFQDAATHIRPLFLDVIDEFYVPLKERLKPCLTGLLVSLLPGIEPAGGAVHQRVLATFHVIADTCVGLPAFMFALWIVLHRTSRVRLPALQVLGAFLPEGRHLYTLPPEELATYLPDTPQDLVMRVFERLLSENDLLVRRQLFDFLVPNLPLDCHFFLVNSRKVELLRAAFQVLAVGEWSLARRFLQWITGQVDVFDSIDLTYFRTHVRDAFCEAFQRDLQLATMRTKDQLLLPFKIFRVIQSEAVELIPLILQRLAVPLWGYGLETPEPNREAVLQSVRRLLTANNSSLSSVWDALDQHVEDKLTSPLVEWTVTGALYLFITFWDDQYHQQRKSEIITPQSMNDDGVDHGDDHSGVLCCASSEKHSWEEKHTSCYDTDQHCWQHSHLQCIMAQALRALTCMLPRVKENPLEYIKLKTFALECLQRQPFQTPPFHISERLLDAIVTFWSHITEHVTVFSAFNSPFLATKASNILSETLVLLTRLDNANLGDTPTTEMPQCTSAALQGCEKLICYCVDQVQSVSMPNWLAVHILVDLLRAFPTLRRGYVHPASRHHSTFVQLVAGAWQHILGSTPSGVNGSGHSSTRCDAEALLLSLDDLESQEMGSVGQTMMQLLVDELSHPAYETRIIGFKKFVVLWQYSHTRDPQRQVCPGAMRLVLDCLDPPEPSLRYVCRSWLALACPNHLTHIVDPLFEELILPQKSSGYLTFDTARTVYVLSRLSALLRAEPRSVLIAMHNHHVSETLLCAHWNAYDLTSRMLPSADLPVGDEVLIRSECLGYDEARCVVDYVDLSCFIALRFIDVPLEEIRGGDGVALRVRSAAIEFLLSLLGASDGAGTHYTRRREMYSLLSPCLLRFLKFALAQHDIAFQIQTLDVIRPILPYVCSPMLSVADEANSNAILRTSDPSCFESAVNLELSIPECAIAWKTWQLKLLPKVHSAELRSLSELITVMIRLVASTPETRPDASLAASLASLMDFILVVIRSASESHVAFRHFHTAVFIAFVECLSLETVYSTLLGPWHILRGLLDYVRFLASPVDQRFLREQLASTSDSSAWSSQLFRGWFGGTTALTPQEISSNSTSPKSLILKTQVLSLVAGLATLIHQTNQVDKTSHPPLLEEHVTSDDSPRHFIQKLPSEKVNSDTDLSSGDPLTDGHVSTSHVHRQAIAILLALFERCPEETILVLVVLFSRPTLSSATNKLITLFIKSNDIDASNIKLIIGIIVGTLFPLSVDRVPSVQPSTLCSGIPKDFVARESDLLAFFSLVLESAPDYHFQNDVQSLWDHCFDLLQCVVSRSKEPMSYIWIMTVLERLDQRFPSRDATLTESVKVKRARRYLLDLTRVLVLLGSQQWRVQQAATFDVLPPCPCSCVELLDSVSPKNVESFDGISSLAVNLRICCPRNDHVALERAATAVDHVALMSHLALVCLILLNINVNRSHRRTAISTIIITSLVEDHWRTLMTAVTRSVTTETLEYRYLGFLFISTLPYTLLPVCTGPCKRLVYEFIYAPAFGGTTSGGQLFGQIAPLVSEHNCIFQGLDRRCFRSLVSIVQVAAEADREGLLSLSDTLTVCRSVGVFSTRETELHRRARELKRLAFMLLACPKDYFVSSLAAIGARVIESLRVEHLEGSLGFVARQVQIQAFLCFRVLCVRTSSHLFGPFWPIVLTELIRAFSLPLIPEHYPLLLAVLKVVDLAILLDLPDFHLYQWVFITDASSVVSSHDALAPEKSDDRTSRLKFASFSSLCTRLAEQVSAAAAENNEPSYGDTKEKQLRRRGSCQRQPLITERSVSSADDLRRIAARLNETAIKESIVAQDVNEELIIRFLENDLLDVAPEFFDWAPAYVPVTD